MGTTPPQSGAPFKDSLNSRVNNAPLSMPAPQSASALGQQIDPGVQVAGAVVAVDHGHRPHRRGS